MRKIRFTGKIEECENQKFYVEEFDNYSELLRTIERRQPEVKAKGCSSSIENLKQYDSWRGDGWDNAVKKLTEGWDTPVKAMSQKFSNLMNASKERAKSKMFSSPAGFVPLVPNAMMNLPNSMLNVKRVQIKQKILNCVVVIDRSCGNDVSTIQEKMAEQLSWIAEFEADGYRCRISVAMFPTNGKPRGKESPLMLLKIKDEGQPFDIKRVAYPMVGASMLRTITFAWVDSTVASDSLGKECWDDGYGRSFEHWGEETQKSMRSAMTKGLGMGKTIIMGYGDSKESVERQLAEK